MVVVADHCGADAETSNAVALFANDIHDFFLGTYAVVSPYRSQEVDFASGVIHRKVGGGQASTVDRTVDCSTDTNTGTVDEHRWRGDVLESALTSVALITP